MTTDRKIRFSFTMIACFQRGWIYVCLSAMVLPSVLSGDFTLSMDQETSCTIAHYYQAGDVFLASARDTVHAGHCPLTFIQSGVDGNGYIEPCVSLCVKILVYSMESCLVRLAYHDGLNDFSPVTFDCRKFPPVYWCSSKNGLKVTVSELKKYEQEGKGYKISLEIKPFCGTHEQSTTDSSIVAQPQTKPSSMSQTAVIIGAIVGTISILFVFGWLMYCYKKRHAHNTSSHSSSNRSDRNVRGSTPNQPINRYAPIQRNPPSTQSSADRDMNPQFRPNAALNHPDIISSTERRLCSPFQPPQTNRNQFPGQGQIQQQVLYSDIDRGPKPGDKMKWYPITTKGSTNIELNSTAGFISPSTPSNQMSQYLMHNQVYKYPADGEMHTAPTDTRYVVYDFDFETKPMERKYSAGKTFSTPYRQSPSQELERSRPRETVKILPALVPGPFDSTTTDQTSDNDSSMSDTTEDDTTDDQIHPGRYQFVPGYSYNKSPSVRPNTSNQRLYDPRNFQRVEIVSNQSDKVGAQNSDSFSGRNDSQVIRSSPNDFSVQSYEEEQTSCKEGPVPQVPPMPKEFQRTQMPTGSAELPWPHEPPPPYSEAQRYNV